MIPLVIQCLGKGLKTLNRNVLLIFILASHIPHFQAPKGLPNLQHEMLANMIFQLRHSFIPRGIIHIRDLKAPPTTTGKRVLFFSLKETKTTQGEKTFFPQDLLFSNSTHITCSSKQFALNESTECMYLLV